MATAATLSTRPPPYRTEARRAVTARARADTGPIAPMPAAYKHPLSRIGARRMLALGAHHPGARRAPRWHQSPGNPQRAATRPLCRACRALSADTQRDEHLQQDSEAGCGRHVARAKSEKPSMFRTPDSCSSPSKVKDRPTRWIARAHDPLRQRPPPRQSAPHANAYARARDQPWRARNPRARRGKRARGPTHQPRTGWRPRKAPRQKPPHSVLAAPARSPRRQRPRRRAHGGREARPEEPPLAAAAHG